MPQAETHPVRVQLGRVMRIDSFGQPATTTEIAEVELALDVKFPGWLRHLYLACNGFTGPSGWPYLLALGDSDGVLQFNLFLRAEFAYPWLNRAVIFASNTGSGTSTVHFAAVDGKLVEWCIGDEDEYTTFKHSIFDLYKREQAAWDKIVS